MLPVANPQLNAEQRSVNADVSGNFVWEVLKFKILKMSASSTVLVLTTTCIALMAGLFFAYSVSVVVGIKSLPDAGYLAAMQSINRKIQNPLFFIVFFGTLISLPLSTYLNYSQPVSLRFWFLLGATLLYFIGAFGITVLGNIPLNTSLDKFDLFAASSEAIKAQRNSFESRWNFLNNIRTIASLLSLILTIIACLTTNKPELKIK